MTDKLILVHTENGVQAASSTNYCFLLYCNFQSLKSVAIGCLYGKCKEIIRGTRRLSDIFLMNIAKSIQIMNHFI